MATRKRRPERVSMTAPGGTKVTVSADSVERYTALGYKGATAKAAPKAASKAKSKSGPSAN